ncbi:MAG: C40 family peptidase [Pseudobutyrivibrio sp.]|nr:C40 family peptidase [Pseudobutyrivibrio sp.]
MDNLFVGINISKKAVTAAILSIVCILGCFINVLPVKAAVATESTVTPEMCSPAYWNGLAADKAGTVLMDTERIRQFNVAALKSEKANMNDITAMDASFNATELKANLAQSILAEAPQKPIFVNGTQVDTATYYNGIAQLVQATGWGEVVGPKYAVGVSQTQIKSIPTTDYIGYSAEDSDDEIILSGLRVNEPFLVKECAIVNNKMFYWGYSKGVSGWVLADDIAFCNGKSEWLDMWQTDVAGKDFVVVTNDYFTLSESHYAPATSGVKLTMGTTLKLVPDKDVPRNIATRGTWNNYVVYLPTRDANGNCVKQMALIAQNKDVSIGYLPMTSANMVKLSFDYLGDTYGWGGMLDSVDCSAFVGNVYKCFGIDMPRNTNWQKEVPGTCMNIEAMDTATKAATISQCIPGTPLYFAGHTMIYLGTVDGTSYVISALGSVVDSTGYLDVKQENTVAVTPLTVRRKNGTTWLENINGIVEPWKL